MVPPRDYLPHAVRSVPYPAYHMDQAEGRQEVPVHSLPHVCFLSWQVKRLTGIRWSLGTEVSRGILAWYRRMESVTCGRPLVLCSALQ